jgi:hypothetical protein
VLDDLIQPGQDMDAPKSVIVVGMPRTGTSLAAATFVRKNFFVVPDDAGDMQVPDEDNPFGYWEARALTKHNARILNDAGFSSENTWMYQAISQEETDRIATLTPRHEHREYLAMFNEHCPWVWKDPRLCYTLRYWWPLMDANRTGVLFLRRDPEAIYQSFRRVNFCAPGPSARRDVYRRIEHHLQTASDTIAALKIPHIALDYRDFLDAPEATAARLSAFFEIAVETGDLNVRRELDHGRAVGRLATLADKVATRMSPGGRRVLKRLVPTAVLHALYPEKRVLEQSDGDSVANSRSKR